MSDPSANPTEHSPLLASHDADAQSPHANLFIITIVFLVAILTMMLMMAIGPTLLLFMNHSSFTTSDNISAYVAATAIASAVPIVSNVYLGSLATNHGPGVALCVAALTSAAGLLLVMCAAGNIAVFFIGWTMYSTSDSIRTIRVAILTQVVHPRRRTAVLANHALVTRIGALLGPLIWIGLQTYRSFIPLFAGVQLNRFTLLYLLAMLVLVLIAMLSSMWLTGIGAKQHVDGAKSSIESARNAFNGEVVQLFLSNGQVQVVDLKTYQRRTFAYFCSIMFCIDLSVSVYATSLQPVLVNVFHVTDSKLGVIYEVIAILAIVPPLLVAVLSRYLEDRQIMLIGLLCKIFGMILFLPLFGPIREWQVVVGFVLVIKASIFFSTTSMSLFTKMMGPMNNSTLIGMLGSASCLGAAVAQLGLSSFAVELFGSFAVGLFAVPAIWVLSMVVIPERWRSLDPDNEATRLLMKEIERLAKDKKGGDCEKGFGSR